MYSLRPPYDTHADNDVPHATAFANLQAVVHGTAHSLAQSPQAIDRLHLHGVGIFQYPRTERLFAPFRCKLIRISPDRRVWWFAVKQDLRVRIEVRTENLMPFAFATVRPGTLLEQGAEFAQLSPQLRGAETMIVTTVQQITHTDRSVHYLASPVVGNMTAVDDTVVKLYSLPATSESPSAAQPSTF